MHLVLDVSDDVRMTGTLDYSRPSLALPSRSPQAIAVQGGGSYQAERGEMSLLLPAFKRARRRLGMREIIGR